jgi:hypothetical protein
MDLPNAPVAHEGFYACPFFTVKDQKKSRDFYVRILGGKLIPPDNPCCDDSFVSATVSPCLQSRVSLDSACSENRSM